MMKLIINLVLLLLLTLSITQRVRAYLLLGAFFFGNLLLSISDVRGQALFSTLSFFIQCIFHSMHFGSFEVVSVKDLKLY